MTETALYKLEPITDDPRYEGFAFVKEDSLCGKGRLVWDFGSDNVKTKGRAWTVPPLAPSWIPQPVIGRVRSFNDYPCVNLTIPAFSRRAVDALCDFLEPNGELLPLISSVGEYYAYNITKVADILDHEKSDVHWANEKHITAIDIRHFECVPEKMAELSIFQLVELPGTAYVSQVFVDRVSRCELNGFRFVKLWPLPDGVSWQEEDHKQRKKKPRVKTKKGSGATKGNTVVLLLPIAKATPTKLEKERLAKIMDEIDSLLFDSTASPEAAYFGNLEGDDHHEGHIRLFLSCPDADVLVEKLRPWLKMLSWEKPVRMLKRYGEYFDASCREEFVEL